MTEWEKIYECLAELEEEYGFLLREQENCQTVTEILLKAKIANLYALLGIVEQKYYHMEFRFTQNVDRLGHRIIIVATCLDGFYSVYCRFAVKLIPIKKFEIRKK